MVDDWIFVPLPGCVGDGGVWMYFLIGDCWGYCIAFASWPCLFIIEMYYYSFSGLTMCMDTHFLGFATMDSLQGDVFPIRSGRLLSDVVVTDVNALPSPHLLIV